MLYENIVVFNHGIFVENIHENYFNNKYTLLINIKKNIVDLQISRESIIINNKWYDLLHLIYDNMFSKIKEMSSETKNYIKYLSTFNTHDIVEQEPMDVLLYKNPILQSFLNFAVFPVIKEKLNKYMTIKEILETDNDFVFYYCNSDYLEFDVDMLTQYTLIPLIIVYPYERYMIKYKDDEDEFSTKDFFEYMLEEKGIKLKKINLMDIVLENSQLVDIQCEDICPENVKFAKFGCLRPIVAVKQIPKMLFTGSDRMFFNTAETMILNLTNVAQETNDFYRSLFKNSCEGTIFERKPVVYLDLNDIFLAEILDRRKMLNDKQKAVVKKYISFVSYMPWFIGNTDYSLLYLEILVRYEEEISEFMSIKKPPSVVNRLFPNSVIYLQYYNSNYCYLMEFDQVESKR